MKTTITTEISAGELLDKLSILQIKRQRITDPNKLENIIVECDVLHSVYTTHLIELEKGKIEVSTIELLKQLQLKLIEINTKIWDIEDGIRNCEAQQDFGPKFIEFARGVYHNNDERAKYKREINALVGSKLVEEKSYTEYRKQ